jgi:MoxR-like ATPase
MTSPSGETSFRHKFMQAMRGHFVKIDEYAEAIALALVSKRNLIAFGPGGFAKSEGMEFALSLVQEKQYEMFVQSCGEGMTEERLFGGVDLKALDKDQVLQFDTGRSFLAARFAVFEEGLDMPDSAIMSLRDTLTRKALRNGKQFVPLQTETLFILTNCEPKQKSTLGASYKALLERFPLQLRVDWDSHEPDDYLTMLKAVRNRSAEHEPGSLAKSLRQAQQRFGGIDVDSVSRVLTHLLAKAGQSGDPVSPRTAVMAEEIVTAAVAMRGGSKAETRDLLALRFLPAIGAIDHLLKEIRDVIANEEAERVASELYQQRVNLLAQMKAAKDAKSVLKVAADLKACNAQIEKLGLADAIAEMHEAAQAKANAATTNG